MSKLQIKTPTSLESPMQFSMTSDAGNVTIEVFDKAHNHVFDVVNDYRLVKLGKLASQEGSLYIREINLKGLSLTDDKLKNYMASLIETTLTRLQSTTGVPVIIHASIRVEDSMPSGQYEREQAALIELYELAGCTKLDGRDHVTYLVHNYKEPSKPQLSTSSIFR